MNSLGLDIGGANLKVADGAGFALSQAFPLWKRHAELTDALSAVITASPAAKRILVTMTGELADCFATKSSGVYSILDAVDQAASGRFVGVYLSDGRIVGSEEAREQPLLVAASNWHILATYAARIAADQSGILIDIGSTTSDVIPFADGEPNSVGCTDPERLVTGELVYSGVERSPLCALVAKLLWRGEECSVAQEVFATTADAYLLLGELAEEPENCETADGQARLLTLAHARIARMICGDVSMVSREDAMRAATRVREAQLDMLSDALYRVMERQEMRLTTIVLSGQGEFLARQLLERMEFAGDMVSLAKELGPTVSRCACAHALAVLCRERSVL